MATGGAHFVCARHIFASQKFRRIPDANQQISARTQRTMPERLRHRGRHSATAREAVGAVARRSNITEETFFVKARGRATRGPIRG